MRNRGYGGRANIQKKCPCGSGKKQKNCHGFARSPAPSAVPADPTTVAKKPSATPPVTHSHPWGMPGEEHKVLTAPVFKGADPTKINLAGSRGRYRVQFLLSRPGYPIAGEREHKFIDNVVGESHIRITKPKAERRPEDVDQLLIEMIGKKFKFIGSANDEGLLGKFVAEFEAENAQSAENEAYGALAPALSAWSLNADVPVNIETIQVTDLTTHVNSLRVRTPHFEMNFAGVPVFTHEFAQYASIYREGLNTNSAFYRYLCFFKIIESIITRRARQSGERRAAGLDPRAIYERIPATQRSTARTAGLLIQLAKNVGRYGRIANILTRNSRAKNNCNSCRSLKTAATGYCAQPVATR